MPRYGCNLGVASLRARGIVPSLQARGLGGGIVPSLRARGIVPSLRARGLG